MPIPDSVGFCRSNDAPVDADANQQLRVLPRRVRGRTEHLFYRIGTGLVLHIRHGLRHGRRSSALLSRTGLAERGTGLVSHTVSSQRELQRNSDQPTGRTTTRRSGSSPSDSLRSPAAATASCTILRSNGFMGHSFFGCPVRSTSSAASLPASASSARRRWRYPPTSSIIRVRLPVC